MDTEKHYIGKLCPRGHKYNDTDFSLRYKSSRGCIKCAVHKPMYNKIRNSHFEFKRRRRERAKQHAINLTDRYCKRIIIKTTNIKKTQDIPIEMVELKREQLLIYRLMKEAQNGIT